MAIEKGADEIRAGLKRALLRKEGLLVGRNGTIELETLFFKFHQAAPGQQYPLGLSRRMELHAGVFPPTQPSLDRWCFQMLESIRNCDILVAGWYKPLETQETTLLEKMNTNAPRIPLRSLEPYYVEPEKRWTTLLEGQKVAIVNAFAETAVSQVTKREEIWPAFPDSLLPKNVEWIPIVTGYAPVLAQGRGEWPSDVASWDVAVMSVVKQVINSGARIALIGCGGLGMVIGSELRKQGIIAIVMGGALQVLFGIKGRRWATHDVIQHFWNDAWVYPSDKETPRGAHLIEGGCYWYSKN
jgi:hypothetical protein